MTKYIRSERLDSHKFRALSQDKVDAIARCLQEGISTRDIAQRLGISSATVQRYSGLLRQAPIDKRSERPKRDKSLNNEARFYRSTFEPA